MANYNVRGRRFGLAKESVRGTAEAAPTKWYPIMPEVEIDFGPQHLPDQAVRGVKGQFAPVAGRKAGTGKFKMILDAQAVGEIFYSLSGVTSPAQQGGTAAYKHSMSILTGLQPQSYTFFFDFVMGVKKYSLCVVKSIKLSGPVDNLVQVDVEFLFKDEAAGSIGSPTFPTQRYLSFVNTTYKIATVSNTEIKSWELNIDNQARHHFAHAQSQLCQDIITPDDFLVTGGMVIFLANETERDKMLANTGVALQILIEGAIIASSFKYTVDLNITEAHYEKYPFGIEDNLLASQVSFKGFHNGTSLFTAAITNTETAY